MRYSQDICSTRLRHATMISERKSQNRSISGWTLCVDVIVPRSEGPNSPMHEFDRCRKNIVHFAKASGMSSILCYYLC